MDSKRERKLLELDVVDGEDDGSREGVGGDHVSSDDEDEMKFVIPGVEKGSENEVLVLIVNVLAKQCRHRETQSSVDSTVELIIPYLRKDVRRVVPRSYKQMWRLMLTHRLLIEPQRTDCCVTGCMLYRSAEIDDEQCSVCGEPRLDENGRSRSSFWWWDIEMLVLRLLSVPGMMGLLQECRDWVTDDEVNRDIYDGSVWRDHILPELGRKEVVTLGFSLFLDGIAITPFYSISPILLSVANLPSDMRFVLGAMLVTGIIPGPSCAKPEVFLGISCMYRFFSFLSGLN